MKVYKKLITQVDPDIPYGPEDLEWPEPNDSCAVRLMIASNDGNKPITTSPASPPSEEALREMIQTAKRLSLESGKADVIFEKRHSPKDKGTGARKLLKAKIIRFRHGIVELYCRPPWRNAVFT